MKKLIIAMILPLFLISVPIVMAAGGQGVPNHNQSKRVEQWHKKQDEKFKAIENEVAMSFRNSELERQNGANRSMPSPARKR